MAPVGPHFREMIRLYEREVIPALTSPGRTEEGTTNGAHNDITRVTKLLYHAVGEIGMYRNTRLNFGALQDRQCGGRDLDQ